MSGADVLFLLGVLASVAGALIAGRYAVKAQAAASAGQRALELEKRLAASKEETYRPMIEAIQKTLDGVKTGKQMGERELRRTISDFMTWAQVYASDDVVRAANKWLKSASADHPMKGVIAMYFIGQFLVALRKDLGDPKSELTATDLMALRITDIYETESATYLAMDEGEFLAAVGWEPPWARF